MKRGLIVGLALLVAFAMTGLAGCKNEPDAPTKYTVKYERGDVPDSVTLNIPGDVKIEKGKKMSATQLASPGTWTNYLWDGWYHKTTNVKWTTSMSVNAAMTLVAKYTADVPADKYRVTFDLNGGTGVGIPEFVEVDKTPPAPLGNNYPDDPTKANFIFKGWFTAENVQYKHNTPNITANVTLIARWVENVGIYQDAEKVALANGSYVVYKFTIPSTSKWENYKELTVDYMIEDEALWAAGNNAAGGTRLMGPYKGQDDFQFVDINQDNTTVPKAIASYNAGKNNQYILAISVGGDWKDLQGLATAVGLEEIPQSEWFTLTYDHTGGAKFTGNPAFDADNLPAVNATGDFYFGLGISGRGVTTVQYIRNVTLVGNEGIDDLLAVPAIFELAASGGDPAIQFPAFTGYPDTSGGNGAKEMFREWVGGGTSGGATTPVTFTYHNITLNPNYPTAAVTTGRVQTTTVQADRNGNLSSEQLAKLAKIAHTDGGNKAYLFKSYYSTTTGTGGYSVTSNTKFSAATQIYGDWKLIDLPQATGPLVYEEDDLVDDLEFDTANLGGGANGLAVWEIPEEAFAKYYERIKITYTVADYASTKDPKEPLKLIFKAAANGSTSDWDSISKDQTTESYHDRNANGEFTWDFTFEIDGFKFVKIQDNSGAGNATATVTITKIEFYSEDYADI
jgi:uncharacterized repeat protein (TIGR02543 family)